MGSLFLLNLSNIATHGKSYLAVSRGPSYIRRRIAGHLLSRVNSAEILCEDPLVVRFRAKDHGEARAAVEPFEDQVLIIRGDEKLARDLCNADDQGLSSSGLFGSLINQIRFSDRGVFSIIRMVPLVAPSIVSTIGRFVNDMNMIIAGSIASGGVLIMNLYSSRRGGSIKIPGSVGVVKDRRAASSKRGS